MKKEHFLLVVFVIIIASALILRISSWLNKPEATELSNSDATSQNLTVSEGVESEAPFIDEATDSITEDITAEESELLLGGDRDEKGCIASAGYGWCEAKQKCLRVWEEDCPPFSTPGAGTNQIEVALSQPLPEDVISSPLEIKGKARGFWFFEASLPVSLVANDGSLITSYYAQAEDDWMTTDFVPFTSQLMFQTTATSGYLVIAKDNPSGLAEHDASIRIPVRFE